LSTKSEKFLRLSEVQRRIPFSRSTIYLKISRGEFPQPHNLGARAVAWLESDIDQWIASCIAKGRARTVSKSRAAVQA
jgi:prophage regulatory protein